MPDGLLSITCPQHEAALIPSHVQPGMFLCPDASCATVICILPPGDGSPFSPLTYLEQGAVAHHEFVRSREAAGFSRSEAIQLLSCVITATIMKGSGDS